MSYKHSAFTDELISLFQSTYPICYWRYDADLQMTDSMIPMDYNLSSLFELTQMPTLREHLASGDCRHPVLLTDSMELIWSCVFERDPEHPSQVRYLHIIGPVFYDNISLPKLDRGLSRHRLPIAIKHRMIDALKHVPTVYMMHFFDYIIMLHKHITGETINASRIQYLNADQDEMLSRIETEGELDHNVRHGTWEAEQRMMQMVEDGNLNYQAELHSLSITGKVGILSTQGTLRQLQHMIMVSCVLTSRAAIRGGLSPETSLSLCDHYFQEIESANSYDDLRQLADQMMEDYIHRVHDCHASEALSAPIRQCCDYIRFHYQEKFTTEQLAEQVGYSSSYLSKKFKREMGVALTDYVTGVKIDKATEILRNPNVSIAEVSDFLGFASQSYFGVQFKRHTGITPGEYQRLGYIPGKE